MREPSKLSHSYIVSSASSELLMKEAKRLAAAAVCSSEGSRPCGVCRHCRKAQQGIHPDIGFVERITDDDGKQKKEIVVDQIRRLSVDACVLPNEADGKAYIIVDADTMNNNAQNAALKLLEEPPKGVVFILCVSNVQKLLPTVRSRCAEISLHGSVDEPDGQSVKLARDYLALVSAGNLGELCRWCGKNEGMDRTAMTDFFHAVRETVADILCRRREGISLSNYRLLKLDELMCRCIAYMNLNVNGKHIFGLLMVDSIIEAETEEK